MRPFPTIDDGYDYKCQLYVQTYRKIPPAFPDKTINRSIWGRGSRFRRDPRRSPGGVEAFYSVLPGTSSSSSSSVQLYYISTKFVPYLDNTIVCLTANRLVISSIFKKQFHAGGIAPIRRLERALRSEVLVAMEYYYYYFVPGRTL